MNQPNTTKKTTLPLYPHKIVVWDGEEKPNFQVIEGAEILQWRVHAKDNPNMLGMAYARTMTAKEAYQSHATLQAQMGEIQEKMKILYDLPTELEAWQKQQTAEMERHVEVVQTMLKEVRTALNALLEGEAKPHSETLDLILRTLERHEQILQERQK